MVLYQIPIDIDDKKQVVWLVVSSIFYFHPYLGKWSNLTNIFQMSWNHQLEVVHPELFISLTDSAWFSLRRRSAPESLSGKPIDLKGHSLGGFLAWSLKIFRFRPSVPGLFVFFFCWFFFGAQISDLTGVRWRGMFTTFDPLSLCKPNDCFLIQAGCSKRFQRATEACHWIQYKSKD